METSKEVRGDWRVAVEVGEGLEIVWRGRKRRQVSDKGSEVTGWVDLPITEIVGRKS